MASSSFQFTRFTLVGPQAAPARPDLASVSGMGRRVGALAAAAVLLSGCSNPEPAPPVPSDLPPPPGSSSPAASSAPAPSEPPRPVPKDQRFRFTELAKFSDGLQIELAGTTADKAAKTHRGAEATDGQIVIASIRIENGTREPFDASAVLISGTYGTGTPAPLIVDQAGQLQRGFSDTIPVGEEAVATVGFAIPVAGLKRVTVTVDCNDDEHEPVSFTGRVEQP